ncbi:MAG: HlyD family type I secretion periplasmic adaptor subunit [Pseudomonadota bacterium]
MTVPPITKEHSELETGILSDRIVKMTIGICCVGLGGFVAWAGLAPLEEGIAARGTIIVESDRQVVQHLEGGIVEKTHVREGDIVNAGDVLVTLRETASLSSRDQLRTQIGALAAREARIEAEFNGNVEPDFSALYALELKPGSADALIAEEINLFNAERASLGSQVDLLNQRAAASRQTAAQKEDEIASTRSALAIARDELGRFRSLLERKMVRRDRVTDLEREVANLTGQIARLSAERDTARSSAADARQQAEQLRAERREKASVELRDARADRLAALESLNTAQDVLDRAVIVAPKGGEVLNLAFTTPGAVVPSGENIMEIVPKNNAVVASVRIRPVDRASLFEGQEVRTQLAAYRGWEAPRLVGVVRGVSADLKTDQATAEDYYEARIELTVGEGARAAGIEAIPGMPVDAFIFSGQSRTLLDHLFAPVLESMFRGLRTS